MFVVYRMTLLFGNFEDTTLLCSGSDRSLLSACLGWWERAASRLFPVVVAGCPRYVFSLGKQREGRPLGFLTAAATPSAEHTKLQLP